MNFRPVSLFAALLFSASLSAQDRPGADAVAPRVAEHLSRLPFSRTASYVLTAAETESLFGLAAAAGINVFELLDCSYRYLAPRGFRAVLRGENLMRAALVYDFGGKRVAALLPTEKTDRIEIGAPLAAGERAMDVYLTANHSEHIEIGTAVMERRFGFARLEPLDFLDSYGIRVQRFPVSTELSRLELYEPIKIAIHVKALGRPKRWKIDAVKPIAR